MSVDIYQGPAYPNQPAGIGPIKVTAAWRDLFYTKYFDYSPNQEQMDAFIDQAAARLKAIDARRSNQLKG